ncbi:lysophospholipid acyltransferase family protein [Caloramator sp. mosi_1]|nr:lysophospholipid acyltransferase family protein [Caloramator sp. mosi_1]WDC83819.1 lysophospholipid acyltransferase family protein [Caloramator sp. mosi_1]
MNFYKFCQIVIRGIFKIIYKVDIYGSENIPKDKGAIICPNHFHWMDPIIVGVYTKRQIRFMAKYELFEKPVLSKLIKKFGAFPVKGEKQI